MDISVKLFLVVYQPIDIESIVSGFDLYLASCSSPSLGTILSLTESQIHWFEASQDGVLLRTSSVRCVER